MASVDGESCGDGSERKIGDSPVSGESNSEDAVGNSEGVQRPEKPLSHAARRSCRREMRRKEKKRKKQYPPVWERTRKHGCCRGMGVYHVIGLRFTRFCVCVFLPGLSVRVPGWRRKFIGKTDAQMYR